MNVKFSALIELINACYALHLHREYDDTGKGVVLTVRPADVERMLVARQEVEIPLRRQDPDIELEREHGAEG